MIVNSILVFLLTLVIGSQIYTFSKYGSGDSVSAFYASRCIKNESKDIVASGTAGSADCYLASSNVTEKDLLTFFSDLERRRLHIEEKIYDKSKHLYDGQKYAAMFTVEDKNTYLIIKYYK